LRQYQRDLTRTVQDLPLKKIQAVGDILHAKRMSENRIFIMGNGGSASTASHFVCDLNKNTRHEGWPDFKAFGLADNMPVFSAYANDDGYENVFCRQLQNDLARGDIVIGISASGNSENVLRGIRYARETGAYTIAFTGFDGGRLGSMVDLHIHISNHVIEQVEDIHLMLEHMIIRSMKQIPSTARLDALTRDQEAAAMHELSPMQVVTSFEVDSKTAQEGETLSKVEWIYQLNRSLLDEDAYDGLLKQVLKSAHGLLKADSGSVLSYDRDGKPIGGYTLFAGELVKRNREEVIEIGQNGLAKWVFDHRAPTLVEDTRDDARWIPGEGDTISRSALCIPLVIRGDTVGVLSLARLRDEGYSESHLTFLAAITYILSNGSGWNLETSLQELDRNDLPSVE
jgi:D-sedoheptulose 7-phosphate isomerase